MKKGTIVRAHINARGIGRKIFNKRCGIHYWVANVRCVVVRSRPDYYGTILVRHEASGREFEVHPENVSIVGGA